MPAHDYKQVGLRASSLLIDRWIELVLQFRNTVINWYEPEAADPEDGS
jgi:hypothetical protein